MRQACWRGVTAGACSAFSRDGNMRGGAYLPARLPSAPSLPLFHHFCIAVSCASVFLPLSCRQDADVRFRTAAFAGSLPPPLHNNLNICLCRHFLRAVDDKHAWNAGTLWPAGASAAASYSSLLSPCACATSISPCTPSIAAVLACRRHHAIATIPVPWWFSILSLKFATVRRILVETFVFWRLGAASHLHPYVLRFRRV